MVTYILYSAQKFYTYILTVIFMKTLQNGLKNNINLQ